ncbi:MAG: ribonuclease R [Clostridia bacterium]
MKKNIDIDNNIIFDEETYFKKREVVSSFFSDESYTMQTTKQLVTKLGIKDMSLFVKILNDLETEGIIYLDDSNRWVSCKDDIVKCIYQAKTTKFGFGISAFGDIYIASTFSKEAMNNDEILVKITLKTSDKSKRREGQVLKIIKRNTSKIIGRYIKNSNFGFVEPIDNKINDIYISKKNSTNIEDGQIVEVKITKYADIKGRAEGKIIKVIGNKDTPNIEVKALYSSYGLDTMQNFSTLVQQELENISDSVSETEKQGRVDRTSDNIYTIDSEDAKDLDDAISVKKIDDKYILSVYIADVSYYVADKTYLDQEALARATSIYVPGSVIPMLPQKLSNGICSLNAGVDRLALALDMTIDKLGNVVQSNIFKAVINVKKKMSYEKVFKVLNVEDLEVLKEYKDYEKDLFLMKDLALILNKKRIEDGCINFDIPETKIMLNEVGVVTDIKAYDVTIANKIIEEFMLVSNMTVAQKFFFLDLPFIYRIHEKPEEERLRDLNEILSNYKKRIKGIKNIHPKALSLVLEEIEDSEDKKTVASFMLRTLKLARYSEECLGHFGLSAKYYCHFTSPIRRYPDLFIHRVISSYLENNCVLPDSLFSKYLKQAQKYAKISSDAEKQSTIIERDFDDLYIALYMSNFIGKEYSAIVSSTTSFGMFVRLDNTAEGLVAFDDMPNDDYYIFDEVHHQLIGRKSSKVFKVGDKINVQLIRSDVKSKRLDFKVI